MAELSLDEALDALNAARAYLRPEAVDIFTFCDNVGVEVEWVTNSPDSLLNDFLVKAEVAAMIVTDAMGEGPGALILAEDHRGRWVLVRNVT